MKPARSILYILFTLILLAAEYCDAQDTTVHLTKETFGSYQAIVLTDFNGWVYRKGNDVLWEDTGLNKSGWQSEKPEQAFEEAPDKNGTVEGWLRIKIEVDTSLADQPLYLQFVSGSAAADVYVDGKLFHSFGSTGVNGRPFKSFTFYDSYHQIFRIYLDESNTHILALHFVNHIPSFPVSLLRGHRNRDAYVVMESSRFLQRLSEVEGRSRQYALFWISSSATLTFLFWLLAFQNSREKNLLIIALCSTFFCFAACVIYLRDNKNLPLSSVLVLGALRDLSGYVVCSLILFILAKIFTNKVPGILKMLVLVIFILGVYEIIGQSSLAENIAYAITLLTGLYYVVSSWRKIKGAQWAIVTGFLCVLVFLVWAAVNIALYNNPDYNVLSGVFLAFQISLAVYVSIRFREIIGEVRSSAEKVVEMTEEKRQQALSQQKILKEEVDRQTINLRQTLENLKATQAQLIQSEKMASLGELTAGIAHEIQNPLNFVNNFSEVNKELIAEMANELASGNYDGAKRVAKDIEDNEEKITYHGKRAGAIVKGMLQHSRTSSGQKELTDINALCDEYLRLAYHGLRAKEKDFNVKFETEFDPHVPRVNIVLQDIGRVLINLFNNAFYAVNERANRPQPSSGGGTVYTPTVIVSTKSIALPGEQKVVEIVVKDNGGGIPQSIVEKIFQPFFTTKPTGQGTGLGLSLTYDIIKAQGGEITVKTEDGLGAEFVIILPDNS